MAGTVSCHRTSEAEAWLIAIDSLIPDAPDSALSLLEAIDTASLRGEMRAYHALLTAQALYKAYIPATSDSLINRAWDYYKDHGSYDRRIRAMLYKGTTAEETGHPDTAMYWYKRTELESRPDDHYHRGYALMAMGRIYQDNYESKYAVNKYLKSIIDNKQNTDTIYLLYCYYQLSKLYQLENNDSSIFFLKELEKMSDIYNNIYYIKAATKSRSAYYFYKNDYENTKNTAVRAIARFNPVDIPELWYYASYSYSKLGNKDSAFFYIDEAPLPKNIKDSVLYYEALKSLSELEGDWQHVHIYDSIGSELSELKLDNAISNGMYKFESFAEKQFIKTKGVEKEKKIRLVVILLLLIIAIVGSYFVIHRLQWHRDLTEMRKFIEQLENQKSYLADNNLTLYDQIDNLQNSIEPLTDVFRTILTAVRKSSGAQLDKTIKNLLTETFFSHIYKYVDYTHHDLMEEMKSSQSLSKRDIDIVCLYLCHLPDSVIQIYADITNIRSVNKLKKTIAVKLRDSKDATIENLRKF